MPFTHYLNSVFSLALLTRLLCEGQKLYLIPKFMWTKYSTLEFATHLVFKFLNYLQLNKTKAKKTALRLAFVLIVFWSMPSLPMMNMSVWACALQMKTAPGSLTPLLATHACNSATAPASTLPNVQLVWVVKKVNSEKY